MTFEENLEFIRELDLSSTIAAIDFDGTVVEHTFPAVGDDVPFAADVLKALQTAGARLILWTMRSNYEFSTNSPTAAVPDKYLERAIDWYSQKGISLYGVNSNPQQSEWTASPKAYAHIYIDDAALGCPLVETYGDRPYVDWQAVAALLVSKFESDCSLV